MFNPKKFIERNKEEIKNRVGNEKAIAACSGGLDSTTTAFLAHKAIGNNLLAVFINDGFRREGEVEFVISLLKKLGMKYKIVNARNEFFEGLRILSKN